MKKLGGWKSFDFGLKTNESPKNESSPNNKVGLSHNPQKNKSKVVIDVKQNTRINFYQEVSPKSVADLVVHTKKVQEVENWLNFVSNSCLQDKKNTQFLLITGPTGCGKTTTVQLLCKSMKISICEWINPVDIDFELLKGPNQVDKFLDFFTESKYCSLIDNACNRKVLLVKDFPNAFLRNPEEFFAALEEIFFKATHPVVFICTESGSNDQNLQRILFPEDILLKYGITTFKFNPCAPTQLKKALKRTQDCLLKYPDLFNCPSSSTFDAIVASSLGDIRCAINQLYLSCLIGYETNKANSKQSMKRKRGDDSQDIKNMFRDESLGLFHGLGRVLNPKRTQCGTSWRLNCNIQKLVDEFSIQPSNFNSFLFENYLRYFGSLEDVEKASEVLSVTTVLMNNWENDDTLIMALWIAVLGLMIYNEHKVSKWNQIRGPKKLEKVCQDQMKLHPTDRFYYNLITKTNTYYRFNCSQ